ncbi:MFS transporter [Xylophilus rhododendri]|uniref:MFS transporter n=1 Tax=Xylophilus rhododendri TaxID=2697032 RepID=A0A857J6J6_9BURK|nr:MFS transporter [Xylophilus rhododendri]QHI98863.1 MFS transporter [Xylophilus rhododendri]
MQASPQATTAPDGLPPPERRRAMLVMILGISLAVLDGTIVNLALPAIARDLQAPAAHAVWVVNAYQVALLALLLPCATLGDLVGYKRVYLVGIGFFTAASLACTVAGSLPALAIARGLQGLGAAGLMGVNAALVRRIYPRSMLGHGVALNSVVVATASVAGPSVAAAILSVADWPWLFALNLPLGALVLILGPKALPANAAPPTAGARLSPLDVALNAAMFALVVMGADALGVAAGGKAGNLLHGFLLLAAGVAVGVFYVRRQRHQAVPLFPVDLLRIPVFRLSMCSSIGAFSAQMLAFVSLPFLMLDGLGRNAGQTGLLISCWPLATVVAAPLAGRLIGRVSDGLLGGIGMVCMALGLLAMTLLPADPGNLNIAWRLAMCGFGFGLFQSPNNHTIVTSAPAHRSGGASGMLGTARLTGQTLGVVLLAGVFSLFDAHNGHGPVVGLALAAGFATAAAIFSTMRVRHPVKGH